MSFNPFPHVAALPAARLLEDADEDQGMRLAAVSNQGSKVWQCSKFRGHITHCVDDEEDDEEGGGREVVTYELEFDLKKYLQRYVLRHMSSTIWYRTHNLRLVRLSLRQIDHTHWVMCITC